ncbi:PREDICTED: uncharacterized protein LOC104718961 isoform X2 [Camelina sativa]|uniref:Uncharacterized protein LOC104718961 isoform X2 n=1 Tax=Camelina sativa TaxID=90675 RepID=A0ABM0U341_CAMSA|nr:PREDICTED: uncharacterized protein LOC104718961 isoform X2 [Camelina sativa]
MDAAGESSFNQKNEVGEKPVIVRVKGKVGQSLLDAFLDSQERNLLTLLSKKIPLDDLVIGKTMQHVAVRILRMWEARNFKLNGTLMSLDMLFLDEKENVIQGSIYHRRIAKFEDHLEEGKMYLISNFEVVPTYGYYKVTDNPFTIRFLDSTQIVQLPEDICTINVEKFRLYTYAENHKFVGTNIHLFDVVGQILEVHGSNLEVSTSTERIVLLLLLADNESIRVTLWDEQASTFRQQLQQTNRQNSVIAKCI